MSDLVQAAVAADARGDRGEMRRLLQALGHAAADDALALQLLALDAARTDRPADAMALFERAARIAPTDAQAHFNLAVTLQQRGDLDRAVNAYAAALRPAPEHLGALNNLSDLLRRRGRAEEGWALMQRYLEAGGSLASLEVRLAKLALDTRRYDESEAWFQRAEAAQPGDPHVAFEHAMLTLLREDFAAGWPGYEARLAVHGLAGLAIYPYALPPWDGVSRPGQRVLLHREQGLGDMIMFAAAVPALIAEGVEVHIATAPSLLRLFAESFPQAKVWASVTHLGAARQPDPAFLRSCGPLDAQLPMGSLGAARMPKGPPAPAAYIRPPADEVSRWRGLLETLAPPRAGERRVGLVFGARQDAPTDDGRSNGLHKSIPPARLAALAEAPGVRWFALHDRTAAAALADAPHLDIADLSPWITDFADTAAAIANLDLVITVDTAVAHLAGAMGKPTWVLLRRNADWRWGVDREDSLWYPAVRLFRQAEAGDWAGVLAAVARALG